MVSQCVARPDTLFRRTEGWQSGRMRRSRKPFRAVPSDEGSNPSPSAEPPARGEVSEWSKERDWKSRTGLTLRRGFKSRPHRSKARVGGPSRYDTVTFRSI